MLFFAVLATRSKQDHYARTEPLDCQRQTLARRGLVLELALQS